MSDVKAGLFYNFCAGGCKEQMESWSVQEVCSFIEEKGFEKDVIELFRKNRIRGPALSLLSEEDLKELGVAALGDRKILLKLLQPTTLTDKNKVAT